MPTAFCVALCFASKFAEIRTHCNICRRPKSAIRSWGSDFHELGCTSTGAPSQPLAGRATWLRFAGAALVPTPVGCPRRRFCVALCHPILVQTPIVRIGLRKLPLRRRSSPPVLFTGACSGRRMTATHFRVLGTNPVGEADMLAPGIAHGCSTCGGWG